MKIITPMLAKSAVSLPADHLHYGFEIKWDGIRAIVYCRNGKISVFSRNAIDLTAQYPEIQELASAVDGRELILDGEIVAFNSSNRPSFSLLQNRMGLLSSNIINNKSKEIPVTYIIFDLLSLDGRLLLNLPYIERRKVLENLALSGPYWQTPQYKTGNGEALLTATRAIKLEGILAKRLDSTYEPGVRSSSWLKIKNQMRQELVIGGWLPGKGNRANSIGSILVGYYDLTPKQAAEKKVRQQLIYAGSVGTGFTNVMLDSLALAFRSLETGTNPFSTTPPKKGAVFLLPRLVAEFEFTEWTPNNTLRHPSFKGLRTDKDPCFVVRET